MATTYIHPNYSAPDTMEHTRVIRRISTAYTPTASTGFGAVINDILKVFKLPRGAKLLGGSIECGDLDSGTALTLSLNVTNGTVTKTIISASTIGQAGGLVTHSAGNGSLQTGWLGYVCNGSGWEVQLKAAAAATGIQAAAINVGIEYTMDTEAGELSN